MKSSIPTISNDSNESVAMSYGQMADDIFLTIAMLKYKDYLNTFLPFLHAHALELSAKATCYKLNLDVKLNHKIDDIYKLIETVHPEIRKYLPTQAHLNDYKKLWIPGEKDMKSYTISQIPLNIEELELAYFFENVMNLKYGLNKELVNVSALQICFQPLNVCFLNLFKTSRDIYTSDLLNKGLENKMLGAFNSENDIKNLIEFIITPGLNIVKRVQQGLIVAPRIKNE